MRVTQLGNCCQLVLVRVCLWGPGLSLQCFACSEISAGAQESQSRRKGGFTAEPSGSFCVPPTVQITNMKAASTGIKIPCPEIYPETRNCHFLVEMRKQDLSSFTTYKTGEGQTTSQRCPETQNKDDTLYHTCNNLINPKTWPQTSMLVERNGLKWNGG